MEQLLRGKEMAQITYVPIRHHSPACAFHVCRLIESLNPGLILVEGPENANSLIPVMVHEDTKAPFAVYYSYQDSQGLISEEKESYKCYYPFLDYSPELAALREGAKRQIPTYFIDLPYAKILISSEEGKGLRKRDTKNNYNDDYLLARSHYIKRLCEKTGMQSFDEFWEKYFEINGLSEDSETFIRHMEAYCESARDSTPEQELEAEGCLCRENYMAECIKRFAEKIACENILVVTGGFHTPGLKKLMAEPEKRQAVKEIELENQGVYLMPYSMEAADALNGYASGMPHPGFYQNIWAGISSGAGGLHSLRDKVFEEAVLSAIVVTGKAVRKKEGCLSSYDEICAYSMAQGLASLRGKREPGVYELKDAVLSCFVKGEYNLSTDTPLRLLIRQLTGKQVGVLCQAASVPPIIMEFEAQCKKFGLKPHSTLEHDLVLTVFASKKHRGISMFLNQMDFLGTGFGRKVKGPNLQLKKDKNLIRETWRYKWSSQVTSVLIDLSVYGATIYEACVSLVLDRLKKDCSARAAALLLTRVFEMGLEDQLELVYGQVHEKVLSDDDFYSLAEALSYMIMLEELTGLYHAVLSAEVLIRVICEKLIRLLPDMAEISDEQLVPCMKACKTLYQLIKRPEYAGDKELLYQAFGTLLVREKLHPGLDGCVRGILYGSGQSTAQEVEMICRGYLTGTREQLLLTAPFLRGLFYTARDLVFIGSGFVRMMDDFISYVEEAEFMGLLPELRLAFRYFTPREIDQIAEQAAALHGKGRRELFALKEVSPACYAYGKELDTYTACVMERKSDG